MNMTETQFAARLLRLERSNRQLRVVLAALILGGVTLGLGGQDSTGSSGRTVDAQAFILRDAQGAARAQLALSEGSPSLSLYDQRGRLRLALAIESGGSGENGENGGPLMNFYGPDGAPRVVIGERGTASFVILRDAEGAPRAAMAVQDNGEPSLYLLDENMNPIFREPRTQP